MQRKPAAAENRTRSCDAGRFHLFDLPQSSLREKMIWESDEALTESLADLPSPRTKCRARLDSSTKSQSFPFALSEGRTSCMFAGRRLMDSTLAVKKQPIKLTLQAAGHACSALTD